MIQYVDVEMCHEIVFSAIHKYLSEAEPAPPYEEEPDGISELNKVLGLVRRDEYYPTLCHKAAYIICSLAGSQYFSNGNKRLAVSVLLGFLIINKTAVLNADSLTYQHLLLEQFSQYNWDPNVNIKGAHAIFLYNLALVISNRNYWDNNDFSVLKEKVAHIFSKIYKN